MADPEKDDLREIAASLAASTRELNDAAARIADALPAAAAGNCSNATINAGGVTNAVAICISIAGVISGAIVGALFATWVMWRVAEVEGQQQAWIQVWQQRIATEVKKE